MRLVSIKRNFLEKVAFYTCEENTQSLKGGCKDQIGLESKTGMDPGPRSPNNEFIECRKES